MRRGSQTQLLSGGGMGIMPMFHGLEGRATYHGLKGRGTGCRRWRSAVTGRLCMAALALTLTGCGYSSEGLYRKNIRTVYVEMFQSREFRRGIEFQLTEAVRKQIDRKTPYKNAPKERADTILSGEVIEWREATLGHSFESGLPRETAGTLAIRYRWQDMRTGKLLVDQPRLVTTVEYVPPIGETVQHGRDEAADRMARKIVESMESPW